MEELKYKEGQVVIIHGDNIEYEVIGVTDMSGYPCYTLAPKYIMDERRGGPHNEQQPEADNEVPVQSP